MDEYYKGILFSLIGNIILNLGQHFKVFGQEIKANKLVHYRTRSSCVQWNGKWLWSISGQGLICLGSISNAYAMAFAPQTLLASIASIQFVVNLICSAVFYKTKIDWKHIFGTFGVVAGCLVLVFGFSPSTDSGRLTIVALFDNFNRAAYRSYLIVVIAVFCFSILWQYVECLPARESQRPMKPVRKPWLSGGLYCICSAMPGTQSVVLGKTLAIIIRKTIAKEILWFGPFSLSQFLFVLICAFAWLITYAYWMHRQSEALLQYEPMFIVPMHQVMWVTFSTISGGLYFQEFESAKPLQWFALLCGLFLNYFGLFQLMADSRKDSSSTEEGNQPNMDLPLNKQKQKQKQKQQYQYQQQQQIRTSDKGKHLDVLGEIGGGGSNTRSIEEMPLIGSGDISTYEVMRRSSSHGGVVVHHNEYSSKKPIKDDMEINIINTVSLNHTRRRLDKFSGSSAHLNYKPIRIESDSDSSYSDSSSEFYDKQWWATIPKLPDQTDTTTNKDEEDSPPPIPSRHNSMVDLNALKNANYQPASAMFDDSGSLKHIVVIEPESKFDLKKSKPNRRSISHLSPTNSTPATITDNPIHTNSNANVSTHLGSNNNTLLMQRKKGNTIVMSSSSEIVTSHHNNKEISQGPESTTYDSYFISSTNKDTTHLNPLHLANKSYQWLNGVTERKGE